MSIFSHSNSVLDGYEAVSDAQLTPGRYSPHAYDSLCVLIPSPIRAALETAQCILDGILLTRSQCRITPEQSMPALLEHNGSSLPVAYCVRNTGELHPRIPSTDDEGNLSRCVKLFLTLTICGRVSRPRLGSMKRGAALYLCRQVSGTAPHILRSPAAPVDGGSARTFCLVGQCVAHVYDASLSPIEFHVIVTIHLFHFTTLSFDLGSNFRRVLAIPLRKLPKPSQAFRSELPLSNSWLSNTGLTANIHTYRSRCPPRPFEIWRTSLMHHKLVGMISRFDSSVCLKSSGTRFTRSTLGQHASPSSKSVPLT